MNKSYVSSSVVGEGSSKSSNTEVIKFNTKKENKFRDRCVCFNKTS